MYKLRILKELTVETIISATLNVVVSKEVFHIVDEAEYCILESGWRLASGCTAVVFENVLHSSTVWLVAIAKCVWTDDGVTS